MRSDPSDPSHQSHWPSRWPIPVSPNRVHRGSRSEWTDEDEDNADDDAKIEEEAPPAALVLGLSARGGWALLDGATCKFTELGICDVRHRRVPHRASALLDLQAQARERAETLAGKATGCVMFAVEQVQGPAGLGSSMLWGTLLGLAAVIEPRPSLITIPRHKWQREIVPSMPATSDIEQLEALDDVPSARTRGAPIRDWRVSPRKRARQAAELLEEISIGVAHHLLRRHDSVTEALRQLRDGDDRDAAVEAAMVALVAALPRRRFEAAARRARGEKPQPCAPCAPGP